MICIKLEPLYLSDDYFVVHSVPQHLLVPDSQLQFRLACSLARLGCLKSHYQSLLISGSNLSQHRQRIIFVCCSTESRPFQLGLLGRQGPHLKYQPLLLPNAQHLLNHTFRRWASTPLCLPATPIKTLSCEEDLNRQNGCEIERAV